MLGVINRNPLLRITTHHQLPVSNGFRNFTQPLPVPCDIHYNWQRVRLESLWECGLDLADILFIGGDCNLRFFWTEVNVLNRAEVKLAYLCLGLMISDYYLEFHRFTRGNMHFIRTELNPVRIHPDVWMRLINYLCEQCLPTFHPRLPPLNLGFLK